MWEPLVIFPDKVSGSFFNVSSDVVQLQSF